MSGVYFSIGLCFLLLLPQNFSASSTSVGAVVHSTLSPVLNLVIISSTLLTLANTGGNVMAISSHTVGPFVEFSKFQCMPGDRIEFKRNTYMHWGLCAQRGSGLNEYTVVHVTEDGNAGGGWFASVGASISGTTAVIKEEKISVVAGRDLLRVNNKLDAQHTPRPTDEIVTEARNRIGEQVSYKLLANNCETFVNELRYGVKRSEQGESAQRHINSAAVGAFSRAMSGKSFAEIIEPVGKELLKYLDGHHKKDEF